MQTPLFLAQSKNNFFVVFDISGKVLFANDLLKQTVPGLAANGNGSTVMDMVSTDAQWQFMQAVQKYFTGGTTQSFSYQLKLQTGAQPSQLTQWEFTFVPGNDIEGAHVVGVGHIVPCTYTESELSDSLINGLPCVFFIQDENHRYQEWNDRFETVSGYTGEEIKLLHPLVFFHKKDHERVLASISQVLETGYGSVEAEIITKDKTVIPYFFTARSITYNGKRCIIGTGIDHSVHTAIEAELARSEKNLQHVLSSSVENFYMIDTSYRVTLINETAQKNLYRGWGKHVTLGSDILELIPGTDEPIKESFDKALSGKHVKYELNVRFDESLAWVQVNCMPVIDGNGTITGVYVVTKNITDRKQSQLEKEEVLYKLNERVKELTTLYRFGQILERDNASLDELMQQLVALLPYGWQYPEITAARIVFGDKEVRTHNYSQGYHKQSASFITYEGKKGLVEVVYLEEKKQEVEDAFFAEERNMINMLAEMFSIYLNRKEEAETLKKSEANLNTIFNSTDSVYVLMDNRFQIISYNKPAMDFAAKELNHTLRISDAFLDYFSKDKQSVLLAQLKKALAGTYINYESIYPQADGTNNWYDVRIFAISGPTGETFGIMMAVLDITDKKLLEQEILDQKIQEQKKITRAMIKAQEKERNHIGQELHDNVNQILAGTKIYLTNAGHKDANVKELVKYPLELINSTIAEIRSLSGRQVTPLKNIDLAELINLLLQNMNNGTVQTKFEYDLGRTVIDDDLKLNIYRIIQEQVNNIIKHANAGNVGVYINSDETAHAINIRIHDDGKGFETGKKRKGIGISNMINRIESFNGEIAIESSAGNGCCVRIRIPYCSN